MFPWLLSALRAAAPALAGYFINDIGDGIDKVLPDSVKAKVKDSNGFKWWFVAIILVVVGGVLTFVISMLAKTFGKGKGKKMFGIFALGGLAFAVDNYFGLGDGMTLATALVTLTTGPAVLTSAQLTFLPERIWYSAATQLTSVRISTKDNGVVLDLDANGLTHIGLNRVLGQVTNGFVLNLANGQIPAGNVLFEFTNSAAQTPVIYYDSDISAPVADLQFIQAGRVPLLVGGNEFRNFATLSLPSLAATDTVTILYADGSVQSNMNRVDLQYKLGFTQSVVNTPIYQIDNFNREIVSVSVIVGTAQTGYVQRFTDVDGKINSNLTVV